MSVIVVSELVSRLLAAIEQREKAAKAVQPLRYNFDLGGNRQDEKFTHARVSYASEDGYPRTVDGNEQQHFSKWGPVVVLRLCRAHRNILDHWQATKTALEVAAGTVLQGACKVRLGAYDNVIKALAEGYGITEENSDGQ